MKTSVALAVVLAASLTAGAALAQDPFAAQPGAYGDPPNFAAGSPVGGPAPGSFFAPGAVNWSGIYLGATGGYGFGGARQADIDGAVAGGTVGFNGQYGALLYGLEGDGSWTGIKGSWGRKDYEIEALGTIRGRVGYAFDRFVAYGTGGLAVGAVQVTRNRSDDSAAYFGWTAGAGLEMAITGNFSAKIEYLYADLGTKTLSSPTPHSVDISANIFRAGVNYRF